MSGIAANPKTDTMARKHGIRHITPGAIASTIVLVCVFNYFKLMLPLTSLISLAGLFLLMTSLLRSGPNRSELPKMSPE